MKKTKRHLNPIIIDWFWNKAFPVMAFGTLFFAMYFKWLGAY